MAATAWAAAGEGTTAGAGAARAAVAAAGPGLGLSARGGEDCRTLGRKLCPLCVFTMAGLEREKRWREEEERRFQK